jgi:DNA-binding NtrC family response regulator
MSSHAVLIVADDGETRAKAQAGLVREGIGEVASLRTSAEVPGYLDTHHCDLVMLDLGAQASTGVQLIGDIIANHPGVTVVAVSDADEAATAVSCIHRGAYDYLVKPLRPDQVASVVRRALGLQRARHSPGGFSASGSGTGGGDPFKAIITQDPVMASVFAYVRAVANSGQAVLIIGETGTGKDLIARAVHDLSSRSGPFVPVNTAGMDDAVFSDSLFGHRRGAFTGATDLRPGLVLRASSGSLFLDEIGDLSQVSQVKLLRLLQDGDYYPLGSDLPKKSTARIIAATSADLHRLQAEGGFRKDLYYRLRAHLVELPPLRARMGDLPLLLRYFVGMATRELGRPAIAVGDELPAMLARYPFPGNVRELRSLVYDAVCRTGDGEVLSTIPFLAAMTQADSLRAKTSLPMFPTVLPTMTQMQDLLVEEALRRASGNQAQAAAMLGVSRQALNKRLAPERRQQSVNQG